MTLCLAIRAEEYNMNLKKVTQKNADGSSISYEFDVPKMQGVPDHPGEPKGTDTVPAWLTPGEFVMNAEATRMFEPQIEAMNNAGRAVQRQQGGTIPEYKTEGGTVTDYDIPADASGNINDLIYSAMSNPSEQSYTYKPGETEDRNQNIYNFAYEGKIGLDTVPNATPFDKSIIMQAMNDAQSSSEDKPVDSDVTLEDLTNRLKVPQAEMPGPTQAPELGFYGQVPPAINPDYIQDNANVTRELLSERYSDPSRQQPATPSNIVDAMASVPNPDDLSPMNVPRSFEDNGITVDNLNEVSLEYLMKLKDAGIKAVNNHPINKLIEYADEKGVLDGYIENNLPLNALITGGEKLVDVIKNTEVPDFITNNLGGNSMSDILTGNTSSGETKDKGTEQANAVSNVINNTKDERNPGTDNISTNDVIKTGNETMKTEPDMWDKAKSFIGDAFDEILDTKSLTQAAMLYLGSRALGYSHAGSINFVGKNYAQQIGNKLKVADKASLSNKYTKDSIEKYRKSGDLKDLELAKNIQKLETVDMVDKATGKTVTVTKFEDKNTDKVYFLDSNMKPVDTGKLRSLGDQTAYDTKMQGRVSDNFKAEVKRASRGDDDVLNELNFKLPNDQAFGQALVRQANKMGLDSNTINNVAPRIVRDMIRDLGQDRNLTLNETAIMPYINKQLVSFSVKDNELKKQIDNASTEVIEKLNQSIASDPAELNSKWKQYSEEFSKLKKNNPEKYSSYVRRAGDGFTPIAVYITEKLTGN